MATEQKAPTIDDLDKRFKPTVINILKNGQMILASGCGEWEIFSSPAEVGQAVERILSERLTDYSAE